MTLIKSISGIRGTVGGRAGENLTPADIVKFTSAFGEWLRKRSGRKNIRVVTGRDARATGEMISGIVNSTLLALGADVIDLGLATTPTVEIAVQATGAEGGIIVTASHNPAEWNALKLLNEKGEFLTDEEGTQVLTISESGEFVYARPEETGKISSDNSWGRKHIDKILGLSLVDTRAIEKAGFSVVVDCINSVGSLVIPELLTRLGVKHYNLINGTPDGNFAHNPEPLPENVKELADRVIKEGADLGIVVDPDVDRLAFVCENGEMFGEEYTLVAVADYVLSITPGNTVSNMSSTRALRDVTLRYGKQHFLSPVGEINVITEMKKREAVIGGEGNGGIIYPALHYGRDALAGIALFLSHLARKKVKCSVLKKSYPDYFIAKKKITVAGEVDFRKIREAVKETFKGLKIDERDGILVESDWWWIQARPSNTEPIIRVYAESSTREHAEQLASRIMQIVKNV